MVLMRIGVASLIFAMSYAPAAFAVSIGIFGAEDCSTCDISIAAGETRTIVISVVNPSSPVTAANFRVSGLPNGWTATAVPPVGSGIGGNPFGPNGGVVSLPPGPQPSDCVRLFTVQLHATTNAQDVALRVVSALPPFAPPNCPAVYFACPSEPCDDPPQCVAGGTLLINSSFGCTVGTTNSSWGTIKALFQ
jgi:hypothetical protein